MNQRILLAFSLSISILFSGCSVFDQLMGKNEKPPEGKATPISSAEEDEKAKALIRDFYTKIYAENLELAYKHNVEGNLIPGIEGMISENTKNIKRGTPELPVHYPRFVEMNGLTIVGYEILKRANQALIHARFYDEKAEGDQQYFAYYVDVDAKAKIVKNDDFGTYFKYNPTSKLIDKVQDVPEDKSDFIKVKARYDVLLTKLPNGDYKIESAMEATAKLNAYRLNKINNEFMTRLTYLSQEVPAEKTIFDSETAFIREYFEKMMKSLDKEKFAILTSKWAKSPEDFSEYLGVLNILNNKDGAPYLNNLLDKATYKTRFDIKIFPIKPGIEKIKSVNISFNEHPSFTEKQRNYRVLVAAVAEKNEGRIASQSEYVYDYTVQIVKAADNKYSLNSIKLNLFNLQRSK